MILHSVLDRSLWTPLMVALVSSCRNSPPGRFHGKTCPPVRLLLHVRQMPISLGIQSIKLSDMVLSLSWTTDFYIKLQTVFRQTLEQSWICRSLLVKVIKMGNLKRIEIFTLNIKTGFDNKGVYYDCALDHVKLFILI